MVEHLNYAIVLRQLGYSDEEIPLVNEDVYHTKAISIEHYYKKDDLTKETDDGRRIYLGSEFYSSGISVSGRNFNH